MIVSLAMGAVWACVESWAKGVLIMLTAARAIWKFEPHASDWNPGWTFSLLPKVLSADVCVYLYLCQNWISKWFYTQVVHYPKMSFTDLWFLKGPCSPLLLTPYFSHMSWDKGCQQDICPSEPLHDFEEELGYFEDTSRIPLLLNRKEKVINFFACL